MESLRIVSANAGPFVTAVMILGALDEQAEPKVRELLASPGFDSQRVVIDLTHAGVVDSWPFLLLAEEARRFERNGGRLVVVSGNNSTQDSFVRDLSLTGLPCFRSLEDAMVEVFGDLKGLADWPPSQVVPVDSPSPQSASQDHWRLLDSGEHHQLSDAER